MASGTHYWRRPQDKPTILEVPFQQRENITLNAENELIATFELPDLSQLIAPFEANRNIRDFHPR